MAAACPLLPMSFLRVPSIHLRSVKPAGQPASTSVFGPEDNFAKEGNGPKKISAQRSVVFLLDSPPSNMPVDQKREVPSSCPSFTAHSSCPCSFCPRSLAPPLSPVRRSLAPPPRRSRPRTRCGRCGRMLYPCRRAPVAAIAVIFSHEGMHQLPGKEMAQLAGETASFCTIFFVVIRSYLKRLPQGPRGSHGPGLSECFFLDAFGTCSHTAYLLAARSVPLSSVHEV